MKNMKEKWYNNIEEEMKVRNISSKERNERNIKEKEKWNM